MNILIVGCGGVGSHLARVLDQLGYDISVLDRDPASFDLLDPAFSGITVTGVPIDMDALRQSGIEGCDAVVAVTHDDNVNLMVAQLAQDIFHVPRVIARVYDAQRKEVFSEFGIKAISPTNITVEAVVSLLTGRQSLRQVTVGEHTFSFGIVDVRPEDAGKMAETIFLEPGEWLFAVIEKGGRMVPINRKTGTTIVTGQDKLVVAKLVD